jgi:hypothetical protein
MEQEQLSLGTLHKNQLKTICHYFPLSDRTLSTQRPHYQIKQVLPDQYTSKRDT